MTATARCPGSYQGTTPHPQCAQCMRRITGYPAGYWYIKVPVFDGVCPEKIDKIGGVNDVAIT